MEKRKVFGKELARMQHWQYKFAEHAISLESARTLCYKAAYSVDVSGRSDNPLSSMAKVQATRLSRELANDAVQVCGALGVVHELGGTGELRPVETIYRDCKFGELYEGTNEVLLSVIARSVFDRSMLD
jgi:alkylation response protein AidB-like acyl-CoA dehydrogenase